MSLAFALPSQKRQSCTNPTVRKEWRSLTQDQRDQFHKATKCLQTKPSNVGGQSLFDRYSSLHVDMFGDIHYVAAFLPWHRYFLQARQQGLVDCGYTGPFPYWDWTIDADANNMSGSKIFDPVVGFGGNGVFNANRQYCVKDGPYGTQSNFSIAYPQKRCLQRRFNMGSRWQMQGSQHTSRMINNIMQNTRYTDFEEQLEEGPHDAVHNEVAGDMAASFSPDDVLFFLHHCNVDRIWANWQKQNSTRLQAYGGNTVQGQEDNDSSRYPLATLDDNISLAGLQGLPDVKVRDVMNTQSGALCYTYDK
ncbi:tyrosinase [Ceratobasidium sp. AG-Ba]|nr:tyrosinase [Ceratobasidium sp. AG-Ba]